MNPESVLPFVLGFVTALIIVVTVGIAIAYAHKHIVGGEEKRKAEIKTALKEYEASQTVDANGKTTIT